MSLRDEVRRRINNPGMGGWKPLAEQNPEALIHLVDLIVRSSKKDELPNLTKTLNEILNGTQHITDFDILMILRAHECE